MALAPRCPGLSRVSTPVHTRPSVLGKLGQSFSDWLPPRMTTVTLGGGIIREMFYFTFLHFVHCIISMHAYKKFNSHFITYYSSQV